MKQPKYPVYIPSKNRADTSFTAKFLLEDGVDFKIVVEPSQVEAYEARFGRDLLLILPEDNMRALGSRLWIREHAISEGHDRHWQLDDNIRNILMYYRNKRVRVNSADAMLLVEDFTDRYTNVGVSGFQYSMFMVDVTKPFILNAKVYSGSLINNRMPHKWRLFYNEDVDLCLQVLNAGLCTVQIQQFGINKIRTMTIKGGNTDDLYQGDGRLVMARTIEEVWPQYAKTTWRYGRPQHSINWRAFKDNQLVRRSDIDWDEIQSRKFSITPRIVNEAAVNEQGLKLVVGADPPDQKAA